VSAVVRLATADDLPEYLKLGIDFHAASPMRGVAEFDPAGYGEFYKNAIANPDMAVWLAECEGDVVGISGAMVYPLYFSPNYRVAQELWWFLKPSARGTGAGLAMFQEIERWAGEKDARALFMIALEDENSAQMEAVYRRSGYRPMERTFIKEVN